MQTHYMFDRKHGFTQDCNYTRKTNKHSTAQASRAAPFSKQAFNYVIEKRKRKSKMNKLTELYASKARQEYRIFKMKKDFPDLPDHVKPLQYILAETDTEIDAVMKNPSVTKPDFLELKKIYRTEAKRQRRIAYEAIEGRCDNCQLGVAFDKYGLIGLPDGKTLCGKLRLVHEEILDNSVALPAEEAEKLHQILHDFNVYCGDSYEPIGPENFAMKDAETKIAEINEWEIQEMASLGF